MQHEAQQTERLLPELQAYRDQFTALCKDIATLTDGLSHAQFNWKPALKKWSVGECIHHVNLTSGKLLPNIQNALKKARANSIINTLQSLQFGLFSKWFIKGMGPNTGLKFKTVPVFSPSNGSNLDKNELVQAFVELQEGMVSCIDQSRGLDLTRIMVPSAATRMLRFNVGVWYIATAGHEQRHLIQARKVTEHPNFPKE